MSYYVRKINRAKWPKQVNEIVQSSVDSIQADAITGCMKTSGNKLSLWKVDRFDGKNNNSIQNIWPIIAGFERPSRCDVIYISDEDLESVGIEVQQSPDDARTCIAGMDEYHYNAIVNDYKGLGEFARIITNALHTFYRFQDKDVATELKDMVNNGILKKSDLPDTMFCKLYPDEVINNQSNITL